VLTLAPEIAGHLDFIRELKIAGIIPQIGHSNGSYEKASPRSTPASAASRTCSTP
jgi:N-acetylglucosamine-6-phosphate deacetylase